MRAMRTLFITLALVGFGCGDSGNKQTDAPMQMIDAPAVTPPLTLDCTTYCTHLNTDCPAAGATGQIAMANCMGTCAAFKPGTQADTSGNTLGCRNYHLQNIEVRNMSAATHCPHTGVLGGPAAGATAVCADAAPANTPCANFCALQTKICGTDANQVTGVTNRYADSAACLTACAAFTTTPEATPSATTGNTLACRVYHVTNAAAQTTAAGVNTHCGHTLTSTATNMAIVGPCFQ